MNYTAKRDKCKFHFYEVTLILLLSNLTLSFSSICIENVFSDCAYIIIMSIVNVTSGVWECVGMCTHR